MLVASSAVRLCKTPAGFPMLSCNDEHALFCHHLSRKAVNLPLQLVGPIPLQMESSLLCSVLHSSQGLNKLAAGRVDQLALQLLHLLTPPRGLSLAKQKKCSLSPVFRYCKLCDL
ncbi:hypothetical protein Tco_0154444 [Tanacetum coccineum]